MKSFVAIQALLLILYLVGTNGRHVDHTDYEDLPESEEQTDLTNRNHATQARHRRRPRQMHGYDYTPPFYYDNRRDYNTRLQEEYLSRILKSLDEIIVYMRRPPPPPPQPVYIPYPVLQYLPCGYRPQAKPGQKVPVLSDNGTEIPGFTDRFPVIEDENQLWGGPIDVPENGDGDTDGSRPVSFIPVEPNRPTSRPPPAVDHGSSQAGRDQTTAAPVHRPGVCETAILTCCSTQNRESQRNCFARYNCMKTYSTNRACDPNVIKRVLDNFSQAYAPVKRD